MSVENVQKKKSEVPELTLDVVLSALKHALKEKFEPDKINQAITELSTEKSWYEQRKVQLKVPEDLLKMEWSGVLFSAGLPMTDAETESVVTAAVHSLTPDHAQSFQSFNSDILEASGSAIDLVTEADFLKVIDELKVENQTPSEDLQNEYTEKQ